MSHSSPSEDTPTRPSPQQIDSSFGPRKRRNSSGQQQEHGSPAAPSLPSVNSLANFPGQADPTASGSPALSRAIGMQSILNPTGEQQPRDVQRPIQSPGRSVSTMYGPQSQAPPMQSPRSRKIRDRSSPAHERQTGTDSRHQRRILTPKSPSLRAISQGHMPSSTAGGYPPASHQNRIYTAQPDQSRGGAIPPVPQLSAVPPNTLPALSAAIESGPTYNRLPVGGPVAPYPPPPGVASRGPSTPEIPHQLLDRKPGSPLGGPPNFPPGGVRPPVRTYSGTHAYSLNLPNDLINVEIDYRQASKLADEKRKRNAGASARFRQRRKEKEQAASQAITDLQRRLREAEEDRDFYVMERNFFRDMVARTLGSSNVPVRPQSPHLRRTQVGPSNLEMQANIEYAQRELSEPSSDHRGRRAEYPPTFPAASPMAPPAYPSYPTQPPPPAAAAPPPPPPPSQFALPPPAGHQTLMDPRAQPPGPPPTNTPPNQDPFRRDILR